MNHKAKRRPLPSCWPEDIIYTTHINLDNKDIDPVLRKYIKKLLVKYNQKQKETNTNTSSVKIKCIILLISNIDYLLLSDWRQEPRS